MHIKICGITRLEDAITAVSLDADMLGFNFYQGSRRYIPPTACARLVSELRQLHRPVQLVGVFVNAPASHIRHVLQQCGLDLAQLSGDEPPEVLADLSGLAFKGIRPSTLPQAETEAHRYAQPHTLPALLIDTYHPDTYGGSGQTGNWPLAAHLARHYPLLLAGGLTPANIATAVSQVQPWGIDVASGIETTPGHKDPAKMQQFIHTAIAARPTKPLNH